GRPVRAVLGARGHAHRGPGGPGLRHARHLDRQPRRPRAARDLRRRRGRSGPAGPRGPGRGRARLPGRAPARLSRDGAHRGRLLPARGRDRTLPGPLPRGPGALRTVDEGALARATEKRFRSEYDYAVFEYLRSGKVIQALERAGTPLGGRVLDADCGGGGTAVSLAEESTFAVGLDLDARFLDSGTRLVRERGVRNAAFVQGDGARLPFRASAFDAVFSHSVIEHVSSAPAYLAECHRVLRPGGV